jgi:hypothetical protein
MSLARREYRVRLQIKREEEERNRLIQEESKRKRMEH